MSESPFNAGTLPADDITSDAEQRRHRLFATADQLRLAGRGMEALHVLAAEIATSRDGERHRAHLLGRVAQIVALEQPTIALAGLREALNLRLDARSRGTLLALIATIAARTGHPDTDALLRDAGTAHAASGDQASARQLALGRAARSLAHGDLPGAQAVLAALDPDSWTARADAPSIRAERILVQLGLGRHQDARAATRQAPDLSLTGLTALDCLRMVAVGELPEAAALAVTTLSSGTADLSREVRALLVAVIGEVRYRRGEHDDARAILRACLAENRWPDRTMWTFAFCVAVRDPALSAPAGLLTTVVADLHRSVRSLLPVPHFGPRLVRAAVAADDTRAAHRVTELVEMVSTRTPVPLWHALADQSRGLRDGDPDALRSAVDRLRTTAARPALADALLDLANNPRVRPAEAQDAAHEAAALYARIGAPGDQAIADRRCADLAATPRHRPSIDELPSRGIGALTPAEERVAEMLAAGATKKEAARSLFVSFHTVDTQLRSIYHKLGIHNRMQLVRAWERTRR
ncbi:helix-turn-helix transcriptional regulator [Micromonospora sp. NBC_00362]|uniref:helix-turn-helix domain-containing protein n=1 Tax=unclassified Micromonospora TaxID=2617518 RepID=UPI002250691C|nr:helix-turn-helix transcriptional regulator [Micromonospora sp. NBC_00362]MCX5115784.1 helix-turn-helix transcriptional regulator [Micromonospora sp. NBC_00362]WTI05897.1 helix-turn-helix transcriptional regulator [Micromonospora sp. NBC_00821]